MEFTTEPTEIRNTLARLLEPNSAFGLTVSGIDFYGAETTDFPFLRPDFICTYHCSDIPISDIKRVDVHTDGTKPYLHIFI